MPKRRQKAGGHAGSPTAAVRCRQIELDPDSKAGAGKIKINGVPSGDSELRVEVEVGMPFARVTLDGEVQFDLEVWVGRELRAVVPPRSDWSVEALRRMESSHSEESQASDDVPDVTEVRRQIDRLPDAAVYDRWLALGRLWAVHEANQHDILIVLESLAESPDLAIEMVQNAHPPVVRERVQLDLDQRLHNFLASGYAMRDQGNKIVTFHPRSSVGTRLQEQLRASYQVGEIAFLNGLRHFATHHALPFMGHTVHFSGNHLGEFKSSTHLSTVELLRWSGWGAVARDFLESANQDVDLLTTIQVARDFESQVWTWLLRQGNRLMALHQVEMGELAAEHDWSLTNGRPGRPRQGWKIRPPAP